MRKHFNIRVYGLWIEDGKLLVTDEIRAHTKMTKLPGGGLEWGEGLEAGLKREWIEEMNLEIEVGDVFHVSRHFQQSSFYDNDQLITVYFFVRPHILPNQLSTIQFPFEGVEQNNDQAFRWIKLEEMQPEDFTFATEQEMIEHLLKSPNRTPQKESLFDH